MSLIAKLVGAVVSIGIAYGVNVLAHPEFDTHYDPVEYTTQTGSLTLMHSGGTLELPLMTTHVVTIDVERFGRRYQIRELALRSAGGGQPQIELFANLSQTGGDLLGGAHDPAVLLQTEFPLARQGRLGARPSYVSLDGSRRNGIVTGNLLLTDIRQVAEGGPPDYRAEGRLEVQVQTDHGVSMVTGRWNGRVAWDPTGS
jgi:hypothetical protein